MNNNKVYSQRTVPFSWENKPGISKENKDDDHHQYIAGDHGDFPIIKLPPSPCPRENSSASIHHDLQIPPPPCPNFQQPLRSSSRRNFKKNDDPFLIAYKECTKSTKKGHKWSGVIGRGDGGFGGLKKNLSLFSCKHSSNVRGDGGFGLKKNLSLFSCKHSSNVIDDSIVRVSQLPISKSQRES